MSNSETKDLAVSKKVTLVVYAPRVFTGGGAVLLGELLKTLFGRHEIGAQLFLDHRFLEQLAVILPDDADRIASRAIPLPSGIRSYVFAEWKLSLFLKRNPAAKVFFFSSLGPIWLRSELARRCIVFVQNRFVLDSSLRFGFPWYRQLRLLVERALFGWTSRRVGGFLVQSDSMRRRLRDVGVMQPISVQPFVDELTRSTDASVLPAVDFVYVASADPHKNHTTLLKAWEILAGEGCFPSLRLTVSADEPLGIWNRALDLNRRLGCQITRIDQSSVEIAGRARLYSGARALVFPSFLESHGLPLVEAQMLGLGVVASELDYVRDAIVPDQTFDPQSAVSLARAVRRFLRVDTPPAAPGGGEAFVNGLISFYDSLA